MRRPGEPHPRLCDSLCYFAEVESTVDRPAIGFRPRPPLRRCAWCGAPAGVACIVPATKRPLSSGFHPSRLALAS